MREEKERERGGRERERERERVEKSITNFKTKAGWTLAKKLLRLSFNFPQMQTKLFLRDLEVERAEFS